MIWTYDCGPMIWPMIGTFDLTYERWFARSAAGSTGGDEIYCRFEFWWNIFILKSVSIWIVFQVENVICFKRFAKVRSYVIAGQKESFIMIHSMRKPQNNCICICVCTLLLLFYSISILLRKWIERNYINFWDGISTVLVNILQEACMQANRAKRTSYV